MLSRNVELSRGRPVGLKCDPSLDFGSRLALYAVCDGGRSPHALGRTVRCELCACALLATVPCTMHFMVILNSIQVHDMLILLQ